MLQGFASAKQIFLLETLPVPSSGCSGSLSAGTCRCHAGLPKSGSSAQGGDQEMSDVVWRLVAAGLGVSLRGGTAAAGPHGAA